MNKSFFSDGRHIALAAPSGTAVDVKSSIKKSVAALIANGCRISIGPCVGAQPPHRKYLSASIANRVAEIENFWRDETVDAILCVRGGFGAAQLLDELDWDLLRSRKLPLIGYSDITALHLAMMGEGAGTPIAAWMGAKFDKALNDEFTMRHLNLALGYDSQEQPAASPIRAIRGGGESLVRGAVLPLNLIVAASIAGSRHFPDGANKIIVLEDIAEETYRLDRCLTQLRLAGLFDNAAAVVFGYFDDCGDERDIEALLAEFAESVNCPVYAGLPFGHHLPMLCMRYGEMMTIDNDSMFGRAR